MQSLTHSLSNMLHEQNQYYSVSHSTQHILSYTQMHRRKCLRFYVKDVFKGKNLPFFADVDEDLVGQSQVWRVGTAHKYRCHSVTSEGQNLTLD